MVHPNLLCRCRRQGHCSLNLPQASWLLGDDKGEGSAHLSSRYWGWAAASDPRFSSPWVGPRPMTPPVMLVDNVEQPSPN
jgi:hypothetical protein